MTQSILVRFQGPEPFPARSMVGRKILNLEIGVRFPGWEPNRASRKYITGLLQALLETPGVTALEPRVASRCIEIYGAYNIEIGDAYLVALAGETKTPALGLVTLNYGVRRHAA